MKISLLSPVHNEATHILEMIQSIQGQLHQDWEVLFVDDGSTDSTPRLIQKAAQSDARIRLVSYGTKLGKVPAFNLAYTRSKGDVIAIVGGDDTLPSKALSSRITAFEGKDPRTPTVAFFKLRTFSTDRRYDGMLLPRGDASSRSGGSICVNRTLAELIFPIPERLVAEDIWLAHAAESLAAEVVESKEVVLNYRIHNGNSNPRARPFAEMSAAIHARHKAYQALLQADHLNLGCDALTTLEKLWTAEQLRHSGKTLRLMLSQELPLIDRAALASMSSPTLFKLRSRFYKFFSGRRGR